MSSLVSRLTFGDRTGEPNEDIPNAKTTFFLKRPKGSVFINANDNDREEGGGCYGGEIKIGKLLMASANWLQPSPVLLLPICIKRTTPSKD